MRFRVALVALGVVLGTVPSARPVVTGAQVGFWASQNFQPCAASPDPGYCPRDTSIYTPELWDALAVGHSALFLNLVYTSDFGPTPAGLSPRTDGLALVREANRRGIEVKAWITTPLSMGTFANENNAGIMDAAVRSMHDWIAEKGVSIGEVVLDLEFPLGYQPVAQARDGNLQEPMQANIDPAHQCAAIRSYRGTIAWAHAHGMRIGASPVPFAFDDLLDGSIALQDALDITAFPPVGYDTLYLQAYRSYNNVGSAYPAKYFKDMQRFFGASGQITVGDVSLGTPPYNKLKELVDDVRMLAGLGATSIPVYDLGGVVSHFGVEGVRKLTAAGGHPLTGAALAERTRNQLYAKTQRHFFRALDAVATTLTTAVTAGGKPNAYPNGCG